MHGNSGLNVNQKVDAYFGSKMLKSQKSMVALNLEGVSAEKDIEARMKFIENECKKSALSRFFGGERYDTEKLTAVLDAFNDKSLDKDISVKSVGSLDKNNRMLVAARVVGQNPDLYLAEDKSITNRALIEKGAVEIVQNRFKPNVNEPSVLQQSLQPEQPAPKFHIHGVGQGNPYHDVLPDMDALLAKENSRNKQYTTLPPEQVQYTQLPPTQTQGGGIYSSAGLATQQQQNVTYDASIPQQNNPQVVYDKGIATGNPNLPAHLQPNVGREDALKRAMAEVDAKPIVYSQLPSGGSPSASTVAPKSQQGQIR